MRKFAYSKYEIKLADQYFEKAHFVLNILNDTLSGFCYIQPACEKCHVRSDDKCYYYDDDVIKIHSRKLKLERILR